MNDHLIEDAKRGGYISEIMRRLAKVEASNRVLLSRGLSKVTLISSDDDVYRVNTSPGGDSTFAGTIATLPGGADLTYALVSGLGQAMVPFSTSNLSRMVLHNTTRVDEALILNCVVATTTITLTDTVPSTWQVGDTITIKSQLNDGGGTLPIIDMQVVAPLEGKVGLFLNAYYNTPSVGNTLYLHSYETFNNNKLVYCPIVVASQTMRYNNLAVPLISNKYCFAWQGTPLHVIVRLAGYVE